MQYLVQYKFTLIGSLLGAIAGYAYYYFVGCASGACAITSNPVNSAIYGTVMGALILNSFDKKETNQNQNQ